VFPSGLLVGTVKTYKVRELDGQAQLAPAVDMARLQDVFVVTGRKEAAQDQKGVKPPPAAKKAVRP